MTQFVDVSNNIQKERKQTVFTHILHGVRGWSVINLKPKEKLVVKYLGKCSIDGDMFATYNYRGQIEIFKGIKGDEFDAPV